MRFLTSFALIGILLMAPSLGQAQSELTEVPETGFPIIYDASKLSEAARSHYTHGTTKRYQMRNDNDAFYILNHVLDNNMGYVRMRLTILDPGYQYEYNSEIRDNLERSKRFNDYDGRVIEDGKISSLMGALNYATFKVTGLNCIRYARVFGQARGDNFGIGDKRFSGEACVPADETIDTSTIDALAPAWRFELN